MHTEDDQKELWLKVEGRWLRTENNVDKEVQRSTYWCQTKRLVPLTGNDLSIAKVAAALGGPTVSQGTLMFSWLCLSELGYLPHFIPAIFLKIEWKYENKTKTQQMKTSTGELLLAEVGRKTNNEGWEHVCHFRGREALLTPLPQLALVFIFCKTSQRNKRKGRTQEQVME